MTDGLAPDAFEAFVDAVFESGAIPLELEESIAVAVALSTQYSYGTHARR